MKRFQRVNAFILAMVLLMGMIPAGVLNLRTVAAEPTGVGNTYLHAAYAAAAVTVDGKLDAGYRFDVPVGALRIGAMWDLSNLYLAINSDDVSSVSKLQVNGVNITGGVKDNTSDTACTEYRISLTDAKITNLTGTNTLTIKVGNAAEVTLHLVLALNQYAQTVYMEAVNGATRGGTLYASSSGTIMTLKGTKDDGTATYQGGLSKNQEGTVASAATTTVFEFDVSDLTLPDTSTLAAITNVRRNFCTGGLAVTLRDDLDTTGTAAFVLSLSKKNGSPVLNYFDNNNNGTAGWVEVPVTAAEKYHIRVEFTYTDDMGSIGLDVNDTVSAKYFVNGKCVAVGNDVRQVGGNKGTTNTKLVQFYVNGTANTNLQVTVSDVSVTKHDPSAYTDLVKVKAVMDLIDAIGEPVTLDSRAAIEAADEAYNALNAAIRVMVANADKLIAAKAQLNKLESSCLYAGFASTDMTLDGKATEAIYTRAVWLTDTLKASLAWDTKNLYLAFTDAQTPNVTNLVINGTAVSVTTGNSKTTAGVQELQIPLNTVNVTDLSKTFPLSFQVGSFTWTGKVAMDTTELETLKLNPPTSGSLSEDRKTAFVNGIAKGNSYASMNSEVLASTTAATVVEFDLQINSLLSFTTENAYTSPYISDRGVNFQVVDNLCTTLDNGNINQTFKFGFFLRDGVLQLGHAANGTHEFVSLENVADGKFHVRVEYSYANDAEMTVFASYYINGVLVATGEDVRVDTTSLGTKGNQRIFLRVQTADVGAETTDVVWSNVTASKTTPTLVQELTSGVAEVEQMIAAIGAVTPDRADYIGQVQDRFNQLSPAAQKLVSNAHVLQNALGELNRLENSNLHAVFAPIPVVLDGKADETVFLRKLTLGTLKFGAAWDAKNLYLYFADTAIPNVTALNINGKTITITSANSKTTAGVREIQLSMKDLGINSLSIPYKMFFTVNNQPWAGYLVLDNVDFSLVPHGNLYAGAVSLNDKYSFKMDTWAKINETDANYQSFGQIITEKLVANVGAATVLEFDLAVEAMPEGYTTNSAPSRAFLNNGITVSVRDNQDTTGKHGFVFGLAKKNGQLYLVIWYTDAANKAVKAEIPAGNFTGNCYVRVEYEYKTATNVTAKYYINGILIHTQENSHLTEASMGTGTINCVQIFSIVPAASASATHKIVATVNNVSVGHTQPSLINDLTVEVPKVEALIDAIGLPITLDSEDKINAAQNAYNMLSDLAKPQVSNKNVLETAQARLKMLKQSYVHAAFSSEELVRDGKIFEDAYHMNVKLTETLKFGAAWTKNYLYLAFEDETSPVVTDLIINGVNLGKATSYSAKGAVGREIRIPLSTLGIVGYDKTYPISFRIGDIFWSGTLVQDSIDYETMKHGNVYYGASGSNDKKTIFLNTLTPDTTGGNKNRSLIMVGGQNLASVSGKSTILNLDFVINNMPDNCTVNAVPSRNFIKNGVAFAFNDDQSPAAAGETINEAFVFGFGKQNGQLKLFYWYNDADGNAQLGIADIPEANSYHLRVEYGNGNGKVTTAKYFVNGLLLVETASSRVNAATGTASVNVMQIFAQANLENEAGRVDLTINAVSVGHPQLLIIDDKSAAAYADELISTIGTVTLENAIKVNEARAFYDSLTAAQKKLVTKLSVLETAEAKLRTLKEQYNGRFENYAFAEYTTEQMIVDGKLAEKIWRTKQTINGVGNLGMAWDFNYLYLTVTGSKANTLSNLKINGVTVKDLGVLNGNIREIKILLSSVGIKAIDFSGSYDLSLTLDGKTWEAQLVFDTGKYATVKPSSTFWGGVKDQNDGILKSTDSTRDGKRVGLIYDSAKLESINGMTTIVEFDVKVNAMPNNGVATGNSRNFVQGGISFCIRDDDVNLGENGIGMEAFMAGLVKINGNMHLVYWEASTEEYIYVMVDDFGTNNYHLRIEYEYQTNDDVFAKYYVNGLLVAVSYDAKQIITEGDGPYGTSAVCRMQVTAYATADEIIDAVVSDLSISKNRYMENPDPREEITTKAIFGTLDLNHVQKDLNLPAEFVTINGERFDLVWTTSDSSVVTRDGKVTRPMDETTTVSLTVLVDGEALWSVTVKVDPMSMEEAESPEKVDAAFSKAPIVIDGILDDEGWRMSGRVLDRDKQLYAEYGFQWTQSFLYIAVEYLDGMNTLSLKLNGRYFTLKDGKLYRGGEDVGGSGALVVTNGNVVEMRIPLSALGLPSKITSYGYAIPMSLKAGPFIGNGKTLRLSNIDWVITANRNHETLGETMKTNDAYHGVQRMANGYRMFDLFGGTNKANVRSYVYLYRTEEYYDNFSDRTYATYFECDFYAEALPILPTDGSAYRPTGGIYSVSGPTFTLSDAAEPNNYSNCCSFGIINTIHGLLFVLNVGGAVQTYPLGKEVGEKFALGTEWASDDSLTVYVDGELLTTFYGATSYKSGSGDASLGINLYSFFAPQSVADNYDVYITNIGFGKVHYEENLLNQLTFDDIRGKNKQESKITTDLVLPNTITNGQLDKTYAITWTSNNPAINAATGKVTRPEYGAAVVTLTATLANGDTKSFTVIVYGTKAQNAGVMHVVEDLNPATGIGSTGKDYVFTLDTTNNSIIKVLDGKTSINYVVLKDGDDRSRLVPENLTLWVSDDNQTYTRVKNFKLLQVGDKWYLYDFEAECMYVKVHYTQPDEEECSFIGTYGEMINAGYQKVFGAADNVTFTQSSYVLTNNTGKDRQDYAWTISKKNLGITGNDAAIRIYLNGKLLYHYVSGNDVVVRINDLAAGQSVTLKVLSSTGKDVMDISNKEGVHEVIYGVRDTTLSTIKDCYMTLPAGTTFPDGSKLEVETLYSYTTSGCHISTDGGITWQTFAVKNNAPAGKEPVLSGTPGGWIFDSVTGRLMYECYRSNEKVNGESHMHTQVIASDDGGKTWYLQYTMPCRLCAGDSFGDNNVPSYALSYSDGIQLSTYDGKGPNVDFVFPLGYTWDDAGKFACYVCYSKDAGNTWHYSKTPVTYPTTYIGTEGGCSEGWIYERSDGVLVLQVRCQDQACIHFKVSYSFDHGVTWTNENIYTDFYAVNGQAYVTYMEVNGETTLLSAWAGNSSLGGATYHRNPFVFGASANEGETFRNIQNITFRSFEERYEDVYTPNTTNIYLAKVGDNLIFNYNRNRKGDKAHTIIEDFDDWFTRTKGGYDNFEHGTVRYEGWQKVYGIVDLTTDIAQGNYAMKFGYDAKAVRSVPYLQDGKVSVDIYVPAGGGFTFELQSGHTRYYNSLSVPIAFRAEGGKIYFGDSTTPSADGIKEGWNTLVFDLNLTKDKASLSINGGAAINIPLKMDFDDYVNFITIGTNNSTQIYVDEVLVISELEPDVAVDNADQQAAAKVVELIKAIKSSGNKEAAIKKAREAFDKLTQAQQDLVDMRVLANNGKTGLDGMINYYEELRLYEDGELVVEQLIDEIGEVNYLSYDKINFAQKAYDKLTWEQKQKVSNYETLRVAMLRYERIVDHKAVKDAEVVETVQNMIDKLIPSNPLRYEEQIKAVRTAYKALSVEQRYRIDSTHLYDVEQKLEKAKEIETARKVSSIQYMINTLDNVTLDQMVLVEGLRSAVNGLTAEERAALDDQKLVQAERVLRTLKADLDKKTLSELRLAGVISGIDAIGTVTLEKKAFIDAIRAVYDSLTPKQQEKVKNYTTLIQAEESVQALIQTTDLIPNTGDTGNISKAVNQPVDVLPFVMLVSALALAVLMIFSKKRKYR